MKVKELRDKLNRMMYDNPSLHDEEIYYYDRSKYIEDGELGLIDNIEIEIEIEYDLDGEGRFVCLK